jgi:hypothetical protein
MINYFKTEADYKDDLSKELMRMDFSFLDTLDFSTLHKSMEINLIKEFYIHYHRIGGTDDLSIYVLVLSDFFEITLNSVCGGDLKKPSGDYWQSSQESMQFWANKNKLNNSEQKLYFQSVDDIEAYT